jgi:hypothetical protein
VIAKVYHHAKYYFMGYEPILHSALCDLLLIEGWGLLGGWTTRKWIKTEKNREKVS